MQQWAIQDAGDGYFKIISKATGKCLDVEGFQTANSTYISQYPFSNTDNQKWSFVRVDGGARMASPEVSNEKSIILYPNPAGGEVTIDWAAIDSEGIEITVVDAKGEVALSKTVKSGKQTQVNTSGLKGGVYTVTLKSSHSLTRHKLIIQQ